MADLDTETIVNTVEAIGRTGAGTFEVGWLDDDPPHRWWASVRFDGARVSCDNQDTATAAVIGLYVILAAGGGCTTCRRTVALAEPDGRIVVGGRMHRGQFETRAARGNPRTFCVRRIDHDGWTTCDRSDT